VLLLPSSRKPASPQKGLWAFSETLTAEYDGHHLEVVSWNEWRTKQGPPLQLELWIDSARVDAAGIDLKSSLAKPILKGKLPGGTSIAVRL